MWELRFIRFSRTVSVWMLGLTVRNVRRHRRWIAEAEDDDERASLHAVPDEEADLAIEFWERLHDIEPELVPFFARLVCSTTFNLIERLAARAEALTVGDPRSPATTIGPLINRRAAGHFRDLVVDAAAHGARFHREEAFAPVVSVQPYTTELEAVEQANGTPYGLIASVLSDDTGRAVRLARRLRVGAVHINGPSVGDEPHVPFGGVALSGFGRLGGSEAWHFFTEQKTLYIHLDVC